MTEEVTDAMIEAGSDVLVNTDLELVMAAEAVTDIYRAMRSASNSPTSVEVTDAIGLLARLEEIGGNKAGAFTLRSVGAVGTLYQAKLEAVTIALRGLTINDNPFTPEEEAELVDQINGSYYLQPNSPATNGEVTEPLDDAEVERLAQLNPIYEGFKEQSVGLNIRTHVRAIAALSTPTKDGDLTEGKK